MNTTDPVVPRLKAKPKRSSSNPTRVLAAHAIDAALSKKAHDVTVMDMRSVSGVADFFVLCTGDSDLQVRAIADAVGENLKDELGERPWHREGYEHLQWVLLDYVDLVVHVFSPEKRIFYGLERLWGDAPVEQVPENATSSDVKLLLEGQGATQHTEGDS